LPEDLRSFYNSIDGFDYKWVCSFSKQQLIITGKIEINPLQNFLPITRYKVKSDSGTLIHGKRCKLKLGCSSKVFELCKLDNGNKVI